MYEVRLIAGALGAFGISNILAESNTVKVPTIPRLESPDLILSGSVLTADFDREIDSKNDAKIIVEKTAGGTKGTLTLSTDYSLAIRGGETDKLDITLVTAPAKDDIFKVSFQAAAVTDAEGSNNLLQVTNDYEVEYQWKQVLAADTSTTPGHWSARWGLENKIWVMGGYATWIESGKTKNGVVNDIWHSSDGISWTQVTVEGNHWSARQWYQSVVFDGKIWVFGGSTSSALSNKIWYSANGSKWIEAVLPTDGKKWSGRFGHSSAIFSNKIWVFGGRSGSGLSKDVWSSSDGKSWVNAGNASWPARDSAASVVFDSKLWILGGSNTKNDDIWSSTDGAAWTQVSATGHWSGRSNHTSVDFKNRIWILGGGENISDGKGGVTNSPINDVWSYGLP